MTCFEVPNLTHQSKTSLIDSEPSEFLQTLSQYVNCSYHAKTMFTSGAPLSGLISPNSSQG